MDKDIGKTMASIFKVVSENCYCQTIDIFKAIMTKYHDRLFAGSEPVTVEALKIQYDHFVHTLFSMYDTDIEHHRQLLMEDLTMKLTSLHSFSIQNELENLIPASLGSLKDFFIKIIVTYYDNLEPIIWAQILKQMIDNIFIDLPYNKDEFFQFISKYVLLNSGPFILKILQMIRPALSPELAEKYNLVKLSYPVLKLDQVQLILNKIVIEWDMYEILYNKSASVGHVSIVRRADKPRDLKVIKIIKPIAIAQTCWEYKTLYNIFPENSCERAFVKNILESNGHELNVNNEIKNIKLGHEYYTTDYASIFGTDIKAVLTTIEADETVIKPGCWFALTMTLAPGIPLADLVENELIESDTVYRARLHRCLDLLMNRFIYTIIKHGFYHGDLHAGNIFYSFEQNQMTLIDFGAVGEIDLLGGDESTTVLLNIIVMSLFYNYEEILDVLTNLLNSKCTESADNRLIDTNEESYQRFREELRSYHIKNVLHSKKTSAEATQFKNDIFSDERIAEELKTNTAEFVRQPIYIDSVYKYMEIPTPSKEIIVENKDVLPPFTDIKENPDAIGFTQVLQMILKYYSGVGVNVAIKFSEFYEFQKAYSLLIGVLYKVHYNSYRNGIAMKKAILNLGNLTELANIGAVATIIKSYWTESSKFDDIEEEIEEKGILETDIAPPSYTKTVNSASRETTHEPSDVKVYYFSKVTNSSD